MTWMKKILDDGRPYFHPNRLIAGSHSIVPSEPVRVGSVRQLLMDRHVVDTTWNCFRTVHKPDKYEGNPLIKPDKSWETGCKLTAGCLIDDEDKIRFWTCLYGKVEGKQIGMGIYYESIDGIHFNRPELGIVDWEGSKANNLFWAGGGGYLNSASVIMLPPCLASKGRFAMLYSWSPEGSHTGEVRVALSQDEIHFADQPENPAIRGRSDTYNNVVYNPGREVFMQYRRATVNAHEIRRMAYSESKDLSSWTQPVVLFDPDELDPPFLYDLTVVPYQGIYIGFLHMYYAVNAGYKTGPRIWKDGRIGKPEQMDVQLAWSRDGIRWERHPQRPTFLENGVWGIDPDWGMITVSQGIVERGDKLYIYYLGYEGLHWDPNLKVSFCLATLRRDGFVSLGTPTIGYMLTKPLLCPGGRLHLNAKTADGGYTRAAVRSGDGVDDGQWLPSWGFDEGSVFTGDSTDAMMGWTDHEDFHDLKGRAVRLHFWLKEAELYSFWFDAEASPS